MMSDLWSTLDAAQGVQALDLVGCISPDAVPKNTSCHRLRALSLTDISCTFTQLLDCLNACQFLEALTVAGISIKEPSFPAALRPRIVAFPSLTSLHLREVESMLSPRYLEPLLTSLKAPSLRTIRLQAFMSTKAPSGKDRRLRVRVEEHEDSMAFGHALAVFVARGNLIEMMDLSCNHLSDNSFLQIVDEIPHLEEILFRNAFISEGTLRTLSPNVDEDFLPCSKLQSLTFDRCEVTGSMLLSFVGSRNISASVKPITSLCIAGCDLVTKRDVRYSAQSIRRD